MTKGVPMRGKIGLVVGLGVGYVLGTRAGRARYEQIKKQAEKVWELPPVQKQVAKVTECAKKLPKIAVDGVVKVIRAADSTSDSRTASTGSGAAASSDAETAKAAG